MSHGIAKGQRWRCLFGKEYSYLEIIGEPYQSGRIMQVLVRFDDDGRETDGSCAIIAEHWELIDAPSKDAAQCLAYLSQLAELEGTGI